MSSGFLHRSHRPRHVNDRPAGRVRPRGVSDAAPGHIGAQGLYGVGALCGTLDGRAALGRNAALSPFDDAGRLAVDKPGHRRGPAELFDDIHADIIGAPIGRKQGAPIKFSLRLY